MPHWGPLERWLFAHIPICQPPRSDSAPSRTQVEASGKVKQGALQAAVPAPASPSPKTRPWSAPALGHQPSPPSAPPPPLRLTAKVANTHDSPGTAYMELGAGAEPRVNPSVSGWWGGPEDEGRDWGGQRGIRGSQGLEQQLFTNQVAVPACTS